MPKCLVYVLLLCNFREFGAALLKGSRALDHQFPWLVQFHTISPCGGVLITPDWVLTAAQCVQYKRNSIILYATGLNGTDTSQAVSVKATYIHPLYRGYSTNRDHDNNIALLKLVKSFDMCDHRVRLLDIAPIRLDDDYKTCIIFGWQSTVAPTGKVHAKPIQYSRVLLNSWRVCMYMHEGNASYRNVFCTVVEDEKGVRACAGNPGSPVVCEDQYKRRTVLIGIASWSNFSLDCGGLPTYLGVSVFRTWIWDLIYGNKKKITTDWEIGEEAGRGAAVACRRHENRPHGRADNNSDYRTKNRNDKTIVTNRESSNSNNNKALSIIDDDFRDNSYDLSWRSYDDKMTGSEARMRISAITRKPDVDGKPETVGIFERIDDYAGITNEDGYSPDNAGNYDVARLRDEQLNQYREIGKGEHDFSRENDGNMAAASSERDRASHPDEKSMKIHSSREKNNDDESTENFDVLELVMPEGIEDFDHSSASRSSEYFSILSSAFFTTHFRTPLFFTSFLPLFLLFSL